MSTNSRGGEQGRKRGSSQLGERVRSLSLDHLPEQQNRLSGWLPWILAAMLLTLGGWLFYGNPLGPQAANQDGQLAAPDSASTPPAGKPYKQAPSSAATRATAATPSSKADVVLEAKGYIVPAHQILVSPQVSGRILSLDVEEGRRVVRGDILAVLESTDYEADADRAKATARLARERLRELENGSRPEEIKQAQADLAEATVQSDQLEKDYGRTRGLAARNAINQQEMEIAESKYFAQKQRIARLQAVLKLLEIGPREERIAVARAELAQAEADVAKAEWRLGNCTIRAPISGTILKKNAEEGNIVNPIAFNGSFSLCEMADLSDLEVDLDVQERDIARVEAGQQCRIRAEAYPDRVYLGHVDRLLPIADRAKGAVPVRVKISIPAEEEGRYLKPEMGALVTFLKDQVTANVTLPVDDARSVTNPGAPSPAPGSNSP